MEGGTVRKWTGGRMGNSFYTQEQNMQKEGPNRQTGGKKTDGKRRYRYEVRQGLTESSLNGTRRDRTSRVRTGWYRTKLDRQSDGRRDKRTDKGRLPEGRTKGQWTECPRDERTDGLRGERTKKLRDEQDGRTDGKKNGRTVKTFRKHQTP